MLNHALNLQYRRQIRFMDFREPLTCPEGQSRKSLAFYYYTAERDGKYYAAFDRLPWAHPTNGAGKERRLIWADKKAWIFYSRAKAPIRFFRMNFASKVLGLFRGKK